MPCFDFRWIASVIWPHKPTLYRNHAQHIRASSRSEEPCRTFNWCLIESSTAATYRAGLDCFLRFLLMSRMCLAFDKLPVINEDILVYFVSHCQLMLKLRYETIKTYLAGVRFFYLKDGQCLMFKDFEWLHCVLRGVKSNNATLDQRDYQSLFQFCLRCVIARTKVFFHQC